ncbi:MAG: hypothetical protein JWM04_2385 [Verrucomicrobiales bacterium]|nr:hypothetical protein [Verrucomicrobiales bacterium]
MDDPESRPPALPELENTPKKRLPAKSMVWFTLLLVPALSLLAVAFKSPDLGATAFFLSPLMALISAVVSVKRLQVKHPFLVGLMLTLLLAIANICISAPGCAELNRGFLR